MKIDIVNGLNHKFIGIDMKHKDKLPSFYKEDIPLILSLTSDNKSSYEHIAHLTEIVKTHPDFQLKSFATMDENYNKRIIEHNSLTNIVSIDELNSLFATFKAKEDLLKEYQQNKITRSGWVQGFEKEMEDKIPFYNLVRSLERQIIKQHCSTLFSYDKSNGYPESTTLRNSQLKIAEKNASENHGHSDYIFEEYSVILEDVIEPNGKDRIFPVNVVDLELLRVVKGHGEHEFRKKFYE